MDTTEEGGGSDSSDVTGGAPGGRVVVHVVTGGSSLLARWLGVTVTGPTSSPVKAPLALSPPPAPGHAASNMNGCGNSLSWFVP